MYRNDTIILLHYHITWIQSTLLHKTNIFLLLPDSYETFRVFRSLSKDFLSPYCIPFRTVAVFNVNFGTRITVNAIAHGRFRDWREIHSEPRDLMILWYDWQKLFPSFQPFPSLSFLSPSFLSIKWRSSVFVCMKIVFFLHHSSDISFSVLLQRR